MKSTSRKRIITSGLRSKEISLDPTVAFDKLIITGHPVNEINIDRRVKSDPRDGETNQREIVLNVRRDANFVETWRPTARGRVPLSREELGTVFDSYVRWKKDSAWVERETRSWDSRRRFPAAPISMANAIVLLEKNYCEHLHDQFSGTVDSVGGVVRFRTNFSWIDRCRLIRELGL